MWEHPPGCQTMMIDLPERLVRFSPAIALNRRRPGNVNPAAPANPNFRNERLSSGQVIMGPGHGALWVVA
jgi:hypothetical protein